jgi:predicted DNA-binding protein (UPF0278 family)
VKTFNGWNVIKKRVHQMSIPASMSYQLLRDIHQMVSRGSLIDENDNQTDISHTTVSQKWISVKKYFPRMFIQ